MSELEHNDGLGDLLRERQKLEFSWIKTSVVFAVVLSLLIGVIYLLVTYGQTLLTPSRPAIVEPLKIEEPIPVETKVLPVETPVIESEPEVIEPEELNKFQVISGSFTNYKNAVEQVKRLKIMKINSFIRQENNKKSTIYKVQTGAFSTTEAAGKLKSELEKQGIPTFIQSN